jgi:hypothetical protein
MRGWSKDGCGCACHNPDYGMHVKHVAPCCYPDPEITCPLCRDPDGAHWLSSMHTYEPGCLEHQKITEQLKDFFDEDLG